MIFGAQTYMKTQLCNTIATNLCRPIQEIAHEVYATHIKTIVDALAKAEADNAALREALEEVGQKFTFQEDDFGNVLLTKTDFYRIQAALERVKG